MSVRHPTFGDPDGDPILPENAVERDMAYQKKWEEARAREARRIESDMIKRTEIAGHSIADQIAQARTYRVRASEGETLGDGDLLPHQVEAAMAGEAKIVKTDPAGNWGLTEMTKDNRVAGAKAIEDILDTPEDGAPPLLSVTLDAGRTWREWSSDPVFSIDPSGDRVNIDIGKQKIAISFEHATQFADLIRKYESERTKRQHQQHLAHLATLLLESITIPSFDREMGLRLEIEGKCGSLLWLTWQEILERIGPSMAEHEVAKQLVADVIPWMREHIVFKGDLPAPANAPLSDNAREPEKYVDPTKDFGTWR